MGDVIYGNFMSRATSAIEAATNDLVLIGNLLGDKPELVRAKVERATKLIRDIGESNIDVSHQVVLPDDLSPGQLAAIHAATDRAFHAGIGAAKESAAVAIIEALPDLCTSKLLRTDFAPA